MGVSGFAFGGGSENRGDVIVALNVGLLCEIEVAAIGLALAGERLFQVIKCLGCFQSGHRIVSCLKRAEAR